MAKMQTGERKRLFDNWTDSEYEAAIGVIEELVGLMIEEDMEETDTLGEACENAAEYCLVVGRNEEAIKWAEKGLYVERKCCGEDSPEYAKASALLESANAVDTLG